MGAGQAPLALALALRFFFLLLPGEHDLVEQTGNAKGADCAQRLAA